MDRATAQHIVELNNAFYREHAASFAATRTAPWQGWKRVVDAVRTVNGSAPGALGVLDVACGNERFARFLTQALSETHLHYTGVDNCDALAGPPSETNAVPAARAASTARKPASPPIDAGKTPAVSQNAPSTPDAPLRLSISIAQVDTTPQQAFRHRDLMAALLAGEDPLAGLGSFDLVACFGFMHHVPGHAARQALLAHLVAHTKPGGIVAVSFWQFMDDERLATKAQRADEHAVTDAPPWPSFDPRVLGPHDHFLGWQDDERPLRFCHHTSEAELDKLVNALPAGVAEECARFSADGKSGHLNRYLFLRRIR